MRGFGQGSRNPRVSGSVTQHYKSPDRASGWERVAEIVSEELRPDKSPPPGSWSQGEGSEEYSQGNAADASHTLAEVARCSCWTSLRDSDQRGVCTN